MLVLTDLEENIIIIKTCLNMRWRKEVGGWRDCWFV